MPRPKSDFAKHLDIVQATAHSFLESLGFRKKGRVHNHRTDGGLTHVIGFQMGAFPVGDSYIIPGLRENYYGKFAVNIGVLMPCIYETERQSAPPDFVQDYDCTIRERLGALAYGEDQWFEITNDTAALATTVVDLLDRFALKFLGQFQSYRDVLSYYDTHGDLPFQNPNRAQLGGCANCASHRKPRARQIIVCEGRNG